MPASSSLRPPRIAALAGALATVFAAAPALSQADSARRLDLHGYFTQAVAVSRGGQVHGIPSGGTVDYRGVAPLGRHTWSSRDRLVPQAAHRRLGDSPAADGREQVRLDRAFLEHGFSDATSLRVGHVSADADTRGVTVVAILPN